MSLYLDIAKKVTEEDTQRPSPADRECGRGVNIEPHTLTPELLASVKSCKQDLLKILPDRSLSFPTVRTPVGSALPAFGPLSRRTV